VFVDGPAHDQALQAERDRSARGELEDLGYGVVAIRYDRGLEEQVGEHPAVFGEAAAGD